MDDREFVKNQIRELERRFPFGRVLILRHEPTGISKTLRNPTDEQKEQAKKTIVDWILTLFEIVENSEKILKRREGS